MNLDQCTTIIHDLFEIHWKIGQGQSSEWSAYYIRDVIWDAVKSYSEPIGRLAAKRLTQEKTYVPKAADWAKACKQAYAEEKGREPEPVRVECDACCGCGWISFAVPRNAIEGTPIDYSLARHPIDPATRHPGWYNYAIPCECQNATEKLWGVTPEDRYAVVKKLREFETKTFGRDARELSGVRWRYFMEGIGAKIAGMESQADKPVEQQKVELAEAVEPEY